MINRKIAVLTKSNFFNDFITIERVGELISNDEEVVELFNKNQLNKVKNSSGHKKASVENSIYPYGNMKKSYISHPVILRIKSSITIEKSFSLPKANVKEINKIIRSLTTNKASGSGEISTSIVKLSGYVIDNHLYIIMINNACHNR